MTGALEPHVVEAIQASEMRIVITGAGGWIGLATLDLLKVALGEQFENRVHCFGSARRTLLLRNGTPVNQRPLAEISTLAPEPTIVLHLAFLTKDRAEAMDEAAYRAANLQIDDLVLSALDRIGAEAIFVTSSGAAARADDPDAPPALRLYGFLKREQEARFAGWAEQQHKRAVLARVFNISGPYINKQRSYALAAFILDALAGQPVAIHAPHRVVRTYVAVRELMSLTFAVLLDGRKSVTRFDSGGDPMEMQEIAAEVARQITDVAIRRPPVEPYRTDHYAGNGPAYLALLAEYAIKPVPFARQVSETIDFFVHSQPSSGGQRVAIARDA